MWILSSLLLLVPAIAFSGTPEWTQVTQREVIGGDIVHWGTGEADSQEIALFKAKHMAIRSIMEECGGFASKEIIPRKQHVEPTEKGYRAYAKVSIEWTACDRAKRPGKDQENLKIVEGQKLYDEILHGKALSPEQKALASKDIDEQLREVVRSEQDPITQAIGSLRNEIDILKQKVSQPKVIEQVRYPAVDSQKKVCWDEYNGMMTQLTMDAGDYNGNMAAPELQREFNAAMRKKTICEKLR